MYGDGQASLLVDLADGPVERAPHGHGPVDEQGEEMAVQGGDLGAGEDLEGIAAGQLPSLQAAGEAVVVGDGDHVEVGVVPSVVQHLSNRCGAVIQRRVHVEIGLTHDSSLFAHSGLRRR